MIYFIHINIIYYILYLYKNNCDQHTSVTHVWIGNRHAVCPTRFVHLLPINPGAYRYMWIIHLLEYVRFRSIDRRLCQVSYEFVSSRNIKLHCARQIYPNIRIKRVHLYTYYIGTLIWWWSKIISTAFYRST